MNEFWASWIVSANEHKERNNFYLHTIGMPRELYQKYMERDRVAWNPGAVREFAIDSSDWNQLVSLRVQEFSRKEVLKLSSSAKRRQEIHQKWNAGSIDHADWNSDQFDWKLGLKPS